MPLYPIIYYGPDYCKYCNTKSIELFDYFNYPMGYNRIVESYRNGSPIPEILNRKALYRMKCRKCGKIYQVRWEGNMPLPDLYESHKDNKEFLSEFRSMKK